MMFNLRTGDKLMLLESPGSYFEILDSRIHAGAIQVFDSGKRESRYIDEAVIREGLSAETLKLHRKGQPRVSIAAQSDNHELQAKVRFLTEVLRRISVVQVKQGLSFDSAIPFAREAYRAESAGAFGARIFPSRATLFRAHRNQTLGLPVVKGDKNKGNSTRRYSSDLEALVESVIKDHFLVTESKWTVLELTKCINREARRRGLHVSAHAISRKFVVSKIQSLTVDADYDRMDPLTRVAGKSYAKHRIKAAFPFARIEQDAVHLPFVVITPTGIARTVYLVLAIDVCTGYPVGWHMVIGAPREMDSLRCLEMYLTPAKGARFEQYGITNAPNMYGTPSQVIFDNGPETKGGRIVRLESLGMDIKHCKAKEAQGKPFIERLNRSLKEALQRLPGCTRFEGKDGVRDPEALGDCLMTAEELETWVVRWLYQDWANSPLERLRWDEALDSSLKGRTPLERLHHLTEKMGYPIAMPPSRKEWMATLYEHAFCALSAKTGVALVHGFRYKGDEMSYLLAKYGDGARLHVVFNPDDFRQVYVYENDDLPLVTLTHEHVSETAPAWTFAEAKAQFDAGMKNQPVPADKLQFQQDLDEAVITQSSVQVTRPRGKREENKETVRQAQVQLAVQRAADRPLSSAGPFGPASSTNSSIPAEDSQHSEVSYDAAPLMTIVNRTTGEKLL